MNRDLKSLFLQHSQVLLSSAEETESGPRAILTAEETGSHGLFSALFRRILLGLKVLVGAIFGT